MSTDERLADFLLLRKKKREIDRGKEREGGRGRDRGLKRVIKMELSVAER